MSGIRYQLNVRDSKVLNRGAIAGNPSSETNFLFVKMAEEHTCPIDWSLMTMRYSGTPSMYTKTRDCNALKSLHWSRHVNESNHQFQEFRYPETSFPIDSTIIMTPRPSAHSVPAAIVLGDEQTEGCSEAEKKS